MLEISPKELTSYLPEGFEGERPDRIDAEEAIKTLIRWIGDDPNREGLRDTPSRVLRAYEEWFAGYLEDPAEHLARTFEEIHGYDEQVVVQGIPFQSWCEHHLAAITGQVHVSYFPAGRVVGLSKLARVVDAISKRLQTQERMTSQIAEVIERVLQPRGVAVRIDAQHACMSTRGVQKGGVLTTTSKMLGIFKENPTLRSEFLASIRAQPRGA